MELDDAWARWPWQRGGGEGAGKKRLRCYGNEMGGIENENGMDLHDWSSYLFEHDSALEDDSEVQIIKHNNNNILAYIKTLNTLTFIQVIVAVPGKN